MDEKPLGSRIPKSLSFMPSQLFIRTFQSEDGERLAQLYFETVRFVNLQDYSQEQVEAWAPEGTQFNGDAWREKYKDRYALVAFMDNELVGFWDVGKDGHLHAGFVHKDRQGQGIAKALYGEVEAQAIKMGIKRLFTEVSITARPFMERQGFRLIKEQEVECKGVFLKNFVMEKHLTPVV